MTLLLLWAAFWGQPDLPRELELLTRIKRNMKQNLQQVPNYTCLETIERSRRPPRSLVVSRDGGPGPFRLHDVIRLEIAEVDRHELVSAAGAGKFEEKDLSEFFSGGMFGNGVFALFAHGIFVSESATFRFFGEETVEGRKLLRYDYSVSYLSSGYQIRTGHGQATVAYHGSVWADPRTLQAVRVDVKANDIPPQLRVFDTSTRINYARIRIGTSDVLLPQSAEMSMRPIADPESRNRIDFTHCKQYTAESVISFDTGEGELASAPRVRVEEVELPAGLPLVLGLETAIDPDTAGVGDLLSARVQVDVKYKGRVIVPKGALVSGRLRRLEKYADPAPYFVAGLEFSEVAFTGHRSRFFAAMENIGSLPGPVRIEKIPTPNLLGVGTLSVRGGWLPAGLRVNWKTRSCNPEWSPPRDNSGPRSFDPIRRR